MHYPPGSFAKSGTQTIVSLQELKNGVKMGQRKHLSEGDIKRIKIMYSCNAEM
jgi:hypothetical protein